VAREIQINYLSVVSLISLFLPHLLKLGVSRALTFSFGFPLKLCQAEGRPTFIIPITSALGLMPAPPVINYCASKAALRSFTTSLRSQMKGTNVNVIEIIPPYVLCASIKPHDTETTTKLGGI
jgi:short-subunit dehydrogenase involved in D-alanine esterification of teichoic acids